MQIWCNLQVKLCDTYLSASSVSLQYKRYINALTFTFYLHTRTRNIAITNMSHSASYDKSSIAWQLIRKKIPCVYITKISTSPAYFFGDAMYTYASVCTYTIQLCKQYWCTDFRFNTTVEIVAYICHPTVVIAFHLNRTSLLHGIYGCTFMGHMVHTLKRVISTIL